MKIRQALKLLKASKRRPFRAIPKGVKKWKVTLECWHETYSGHDSCDGDTIHEVEARNAASAIKKAKKQELNHGRGKRWSQARWTQNERAVQIWV